MRRLGPLLVVGLAQALLCAGPGVGEPWPQPIASYRLTARLDPLASTVDGRAAVRWRNPAGTAVSELCLHLYPNAFSGPRTSYLRDAEEETIARLEAEGWGGIDLVRAASGGRDLVAALRFASPDDGNPEDRTVAWLPLPEAVAPGGEIDLDLAFRTRLPPLVDRTGHGGDFHFVAQWFPKVARLRADGRWSCHQFTPTAEFHADFGSYEAEITVPLGWEIAATGVSRSRQSGAGTERGVFVAEGVHDFAWAAAPGLVRRTVTIPRPYGPVLLHLVLPAAERGLASRLEATVTRGIRLLEEWLGPYPYPTLTVLVPPPAGLSAAAMEYPTLITVPPGPSRFLALEEVALHELAHQWWYGIVAFDEAEEPFLDEGLATYTAARLISRLFGGRRPGILLAGLPVPLPGPPLDPFVELRLRRSAAAPVDPVRRPAWGYADREAYGDLAYDGMALALAQLEATVGRARFDAGLGLFAHRHRFGHPREPDLVHALSEAAATDLEPLWEELVGRRGPIDLRLALATSRPAEEAYENVVRVERRGEPRLPVVVELRLASGTAIRVPWDGRSDWLRLRHRGARLDAAVIDPDRSLPGDTNRLDDGRRTAPDPRPRRRFTQWLRALVQVLLEGLADLA